MLYTSVTHISHELGTCDTSLYGTIMNWTTVNTWLCWWPCVTILFNTKQQVSHGVIVHTQAFS